MARNGTRGGKVFLAALVSLFSLGAVEGAVRVLAIAPALPAQQGRWVRDAHLPYKMQPHSTLRSVTQEYSVTYRHNSLGLRDRDHARQKPPGVLRVLALGDSFTYGTGVALRATYLARLEAMLNQRAGKPHRVEIIKAGLPRYFPEPERRLLASYGRSFRPDVVLVAFTPNDVTETAVGSDIIRPSSDGHLRTRYAQALGPLAAWGFVHSHALRTLLAGYTYGRILAESPVHPDDVYRLGGRHEPHWQRVEEEYARMAALTAGDGAQLILTHIPLKGDWSTRDVSYPARRLRAWAESRSIPFVDTLQPMVSAGGQASLYFEVDSHTNPRGHEVIAQALFPVLATALPDEAPPAPSLQASDPVTRSSSRPKLPSPPDPRHGPLPR